MTKNRAIQLRASFSRTPEFVRVAEFPGTEGYNPEAAFRRWNPPWVRYTGGAIGFTLLQPHFGTHLVHLQARLNASGCVTTPKTVSVTLEPYQMATYMLRGSALEQFLAAARARGYRFSSSLTVLSTPCAGGLSGSVVAEALELRERVSDTAIESVRARAVVFDGPDFLPYWKLTRVWAIHNDLGPILVTRHLSKPNVVFDESGTGVRCPHCRPTTARREIHWWRLTYSSGGLFAGIRCLSTRGGFRLDSIDLEGPAGADPLSAMPLPR